MNQKQKAINRRRHLDRYRTKHGCRSCGIKDTRILQWAHIKPALRSKRDQASQNRSTIATLMYGNRSKLMQEVRKCEILCANCHAIETYESGVLQRASNDIDKD